jgi:hypothetical protein
VSIWASRLDEDEARWAEMPPLVAVLAAEDLLRAAEAACQRGDYESIRCLFASALAGARVIGEEHPAWPTLNSAGLLLSGVLALALCD